MTDSDLKQTAAAMLDFAEHHDPTRIEARLAEMGKTAWDAFLPGCVPDFNCRIWLYRVKPEPVTRPWRDKFDVPPICWLRDKGCNYERLIIGFEMNGYISTVGGVNSPVRASSFSEVIWDEMEYSVDRINWHTCTIQEP